MRHFKVETFKEWDISKVRHVMNETSFKHETFQKWDIFKLRQFLSMRHFKNEIFQEWDILSMRHFKSETFQSWDISKVKHFKIWDISKLRHFKSETFKEWGISKVRHFKSKSFQKWDIFYTDFKILMTLLFVLYLALIYELTLIFPFRHVRCYHYSHSRTSQWLAFKEVTRATIHNALHWCSHQVVRVPTSRKAGF